MIFPVSHRNWRKRRVDYWGQRVCWPPSQIIGGGGGWLAPPAPPPPPPLFLRLCNRREKKIASTVKEATVKEQNLILGKQIISQKCWYPPFCIPICINDTPFELYVFWSSDTERSIKLTFSKSVSLSFKTRQMTLSNMPQEKSNVPAY